MRVLLVTEALVFGGAETFVLRLARRLRQDGLGAEILCLNPDFEDARLVGQYPDVPIHRVPLRGLRTLKRADRIGRAMGIDLELQQRRAVRWVERHLVGRFDIYHSHLFGADWLLTRVKRRHSDVRIVSTLHGDYALYEARAKVTERNNLLGWHAKLAETLHAVDRWVTIARPQHRQFADGFGADPQRLVAIPNGYAPPSSPKGVERSPGNPLTFIMVARGMREKGWGFLIDAFGRLTGDCRLMLVGEGTFLAELRRTHDADPRIEFSGVHPNPVEVIAAADVFVHPSIYRAESLPTVIIEALYAGVPVIATDVGEVATMLAAPGGALAGTLLLAEEATLSDRLTIAMQAYLDDSTLQATHAALAGAAFVKFDMAACAAAYARLYREVASNLSTRASH